MAPGGRGMCMPAWSSGVLWGGSCPIHSDRRFRKFRVFGREKPWSTDHADSGSRLNPSGRTIASPVDPPEAYWFALVAGQFFPPDPPACATQN